jgi:LysM repeat protein
MKNLKIAGLVVGLHALALVLIFVNPGCSSTSKPAPVATAPVRPSDAPPAIALAAAAPAPAVAVPANESAPGPVRYSPTRPGTPVAVALETEPVADVTPVTTYVVVRGDTLSTIAHRHHLTMAELRAANGLKSGAALQVGQKLVLPAKAGSGPAAAAGATASTAASASAASAPGGAPGAAEKPLEPGAAKAPVDGVKHTVKAGETLGSIARHYNVRLGDIAAANNIADPKRIRPGQELIIPGKSAARTPKTGKAKPAATPATAAAGPAPALAKPTTTSAEGASAAAAPVPGQDLDAGLKTAAPADIPIVKVEDGSAPPPKNP